MPHVLLFCTFMILMFLFLNLLKNWNFPNPLWKQTYYLLTTRWLSMHLFTLAHMSMHESCLLVRRPCFNTMKLWTFDPNLHLPLADTTFCLLSCLFVFSLIYLLSCFFACYVYHAYLLYASFTCSLCLFPSIACLLVSCLCLCTYTHGAKTLGAKMQACRYKPSGNVQ